MLNDKEYRIKEVQSIEKELGKLYRAQYNLGSYELDKPIRHGWYKHLKLREDISRRKDAFIFQNIIDVAGLEVWGRNKKHVELVWTKENSSKKDIQFPGIMKLNEKKYNSLLPKAKMQFEGFEQYWTNWGLRVMKYYCRTPRYYFVMSYTKAFITHRKIINPELQERIDELKALLMREGYYQYSSETWRYRDEWKWSFRQKKARRKVKITLTNFAKDEEVDEFVYKDIAKTI